MRLLASHGGAGRGWRRAGAFPLAFLCLLAAFLAAPAAAREAAALAEDEAVEARMVTITQDLRCLVCQNESLAASRADLAMDLRREVREQIKLGKSDQEILDFMVARYGDFVLYRPAFKATTLLLWVGPFLLLLAGVAALALYLRRRSRRVVTTGLTPEEQEQADKLLDLGADENKQ